MELLYELHASTYDLVWAPYLARSHAATHRALGPIADERILDVGCGSGLLLARLAASAPSAELEGIDASAQMLRRARRRLGERAPLTVARAQALPFPDASFDVVVSSSVLHGVPGAPVDILGEWLRVLRPGGRLVVTDWRPDHLGTRLQVAALRRLGIGPLRPLTAVELWDAVRAAGADPRRIAVYSAQGWGLATLAATASSAGGA